MMNKRIKRLWIKALTSGDYEQGKEQLRYDHKFCCLAVLSDLYAKEEGVDWEEEGGGFSIHGDTHTLPPQVQAWAGLPDAVGCLPESRFPKYSSLAEQNDSGAKFPRIAELIDKYL